MELVGLLSETMALLRNSSELKPDHTIVEKYPDHLVRYHGDPNQIRQVFWNLTRNAIQAMPLGGELRVSLQAKKGGEVVIAFEDTGSGMSREQKERLFEPFNSSSGGTGLGMAIVYQLMRDHNGQVGVESEEGKGTRISIKLPASGRIADEVVSSDAATRVNVDAPAVMASKL